MAKKTEGKAAKNSGVKIIAKYDCGMPHHLSIRGHGAGLSWEHGKPMNCTKNDQWEFEIIGVEDNFEFKVLLNDQVFEIGENHRAMMGENIIITPRFH